MNRYDLKFDALINCRDKQAGRLQKVLVDLKTQEVTHLVVSAGLIFKQTVNLPLSLVESTDDPREIQLSVFSDELSKFSSASSKGTTPDEGLIQTPESAQEEVVEMVTAPQIEDLGAVTIGNDFAEAVLLSAETAVSSLENNIGRLSHVMTDISSGIIVQLVVTLGTRLRQSLVIPAELIEKLDEQMILVAVTKDETDALPEYFVSWNMPEQDEPESDTILSEAAPLSGNVALTNDLTKALTADPITETAVIEMTCDRGVVTLMGEVSDQLTKETAVAIISQHPDVFTINNELKIAH